MGSFYFIRWLCVYFWFAFVLIYIINKIPKEQTLKSTVVHFFTLCCTNLQRSDIKNSLKYSKNSSELIANPPALFVLLRLDNITFQFIKNGPRFSGNTLHGTVSINTKLSNFAHFLTLVTKASFSSAFWWRYWWRWPNQGLFVYFSYNYRPGCIF